VADQEHDVRTELLRHLLHKVDQDPFPSATMLDQIEELLAPEDVHRYAEVLMNKIEGDDFPSLDMIKRVMALV
jgi:hypothetical protein